MNLFGIETEYGLSVEGHTAAEQMEDSSAFVSSFPFDAYEGWDYSNETPRNDIRGFSVERLENDPLDAQWDVGRQRIPEKEAPNNRVLVNGARFYNDHGHPEYATPECRRIADLVAHDLAGERLVRETAKAYEKRIGKKVRVFKNNSDYHGASYGTHENYLVPRAIPFEKLLKGLLPLLITRPILAGAGKVGSEVGRPCKYQISQRAEFLHELANVETLYRRPLFNTRDEPHADAKKWLRLHVICGDANRMPWSTAMKVGMLRIALELLNIGECPEWQICQPTRAAEMLSKDETLKWNVELENTSWTTGLDILESYLDAGERFLRGRDAETDWILSEWRLALLDCSTDPMLLSDRVDWVAKLKMFQEYASSNGWNHHTMQSLELEYHDIDPSVSLFSTLERMGRVQKILDENRIIDSMTTPPGDTRAFLRGDLVKRFRDKIVNLGWKNAKLRIGDEIRTIELPVEWKNGVQIASVNDAEDWLRILE